MYIENFKQTLKPTSERPLVIKELFAVDFYHLLHAIANKEEKVSMLQCLC